MIDDINKDIRKNEAIIEGAEEEKARLQEALKQLELQDKAEFLEKWVNDEKLDESTVYLLPLPLVQRFSKETLVTLDKYFGGWAAQEVSYPCVTKTRYAAGDADESAECEYTNDKATMEIPDKFKELKLDLKFMDCDCIETCVPEPEPKSALEWSGDHDGLWGKGEIWANVAVLYKGTNAGLERLKLDELLSMGLLDV